MGRNIVRPIENIDFFEYINVSKKMMGRNIVRPIKNDGS